MPLPIPEHYRQVLKNVEENWAMERLLQDFKAVNGNNGLTKAQVDHLKALLAWGDLKAAEQLEGCDRFTHPNEIIAQLLGIEEKSVKTEIARSITPRVKQLLNTTPGKRVKTEAIPAWLREQGYRQPISLPGTGGEIQRGRSPISGNATRLTHNTSDKDNLDHATDGFVPLYPQKLAVLPTFYGREEQLKRLDTLLYDLESRLILVYGRGGVGKTCLINKWLESVQADFPYFFWRKIWDHPSLSQLVWEIMQQFPNYTKADMPDSADQQIDWLLSGLCTHKCLVILDDFHNLFPLDSHHPTDVFSLHTTESKGYEILFEKLATNQDFQYSQSCVVGIGWQQPQGLVRVDDPRSPIPNLKLKGLDFDAAQHILAECDLMYDLHSWQQLVEKYRGVPYSLKLVGNHICHIYDRDVARFLADETVFLGQTEDLICQQFNDIPDTCKLVLLVLSKKGGCTSASKIRHQINQQHQLELSTSDVGRSLQILYERNLIEKEGDRFNPPPDITKYSLKRYQLYLPHLIKQLQSPELE